jgi:hypothetical protein
MKTHFNHSRNDDRLAFEYLETRRMLAGDFQAGDANKDYYFDEADWVQVWKFGKFNTGESAVWEEGDWNGDGLFNVDDVFSAIRAVGTQYRMGPYDDDAGPAVNELLPLAVTGEADMTIFYLPGSGDVIAIAPAGTTSLHLVSGSGSFSGIRGSGLFDFATANGQFNNDLGFGPSWIEHPGLLPIGWNEQQVIDDLLVDGSALGGGGLGNVRLGASGDLPAERPEDAFVSAAELPPSFVQREEANALLTYDPQTGDILIEALDIPMVAVELISPEGFFTGTVGAEQRYTIGAFDEATPQRFFRAAADAPDGNVGPTLAFAQIYLPGIARTGLSASEFAAGVQPGGVIDPRGPLKFALEIGPSFAECQSHLADGVMAGDANLDGQFNSQDLVTVFQAGEYEDETSGNSTWSEGDWTCDGDFNTGDLVAAFQAGNYELPAAAIALRLSDDWRYVASFRHVDIAMRVTDGSDDKSDTNRKELLGTAISSGFRSLSHDSEFIRNLATDNVMMDLDSI